MADPRTKAYLDLDFLRRPELRAIRLQTELLKPGMLMDEAHVRSTVCVFGSARTPSPEHAEQLLADARAAAGNNGDHEALEAAERQVENSRYYEQAREFSRLISRYGQADGMLDFVVITGGGPGIMEAANRGAKDEDCMSIGLNITLEHEQFPNPYISPELNFTLHYFSIRKMHFLMRARALVAFPGGFGTMDELFETLTLIQTHKSLMIPVVLFGREFWDGLINWELFVERGMISPPDLNLFRYAETPEEGLQHVLDFWDLPFDAPPVDLGDRLAVEEE